MCDRKTSPRLGAIGGPSGRDAVEKGEGLRLRRALQQGEGALAGDLAERAVGGVALGLAGRLGVTEPVLYSGAEAVRGRGLRGLSMRGVGDRPRRRH